MVCIDGPCASGKTTFAKMIEDVLSLKVFHMDDYFLQPYQKTAQRSKEIGGNVDYERVKKEIFEAAPYNYHTVVPFPGL